MTSCCNHLTRLLLALALLGAGCAERRDPAPPVQVAASAGSAQRITEALASDPEVEALIAPYRQQMEETMSEVLALCPVEMRTAHPEGNLGALVADIVLDRARRDADVPVAACVVNNGGLRTRWSPGEITLGLVYELMPFDNEISLLRLSARQVETLADQLADRRGEPVAGLSFVIQDGRASGLEIGGEPVSGGDYWIATNDYLAGGGGGMPVLWEPQEVRRTGILVRDAIADAVRAWGERKSGEGPGSIPEPSMGRIRSAD